MPQSDKDDLKEIRENSQYGENFWHALREEGNTDVRYLSGNPWDEQDRRARENRPMITTDELNQYTNQLINTVRQNPRAIKATPAGEGATDATARFTSNLIRTIEYRSHALTAYMTMLENAVMRGFGFMRILPQYVAPTNAAEQELRFVEVPNPNMVTIDPDAQHPTARDMGWAFVKERWTTEKFERTFKDARKIKGVNMAWSGSGDWVSSDKKHTTVAEYWRIRYESRKLLRLENPLPSDAPSGTPPPNPSDVFEDERADDDKRTVLTDRMEDWPVVEQLWTNGVEILTERTETPAWLGKYVPIIACYGKVLFKDDDKGTANRLLMSLIRLARQPYKALCYVRSTQTEMAAMIPKVPVVGYKGQFRDLEADWSRAPYEPLAFIEAHAVTEETKGLNGGQGVTLPLPTRIAYDAAAQIQGLEVLAEGFRRAIQAAIGTSPQSTPQQREKLDISGAARDEMKDANQVGSFHFVDHYEESIAHGGVILADAIPHYYDTARSVALQQRDGTTEVVRINDPHWVKPGETSPTHLPVEDIEHDITVEAGPSFDSEREAAESLTDTLLSNQALPQIVGPQAMAKLWALALKLRDGGPIVAQMADILSPPLQANGQMDPKAMVEQLQQALKQAQQVGQEAMQKLATKQPELDVKLKIAQMEDATKQKLAGLSDETATTVAAIKADSAQTIALLNAQNKHIADAIAALHEARESLKLQTHEKQTQQASQIHDAALEAASAAHQSAVHQVPAAQPPEPEVDTAAPNADTTA